MSNGLIALGVLLWLLSVILTFGFLTTKEDKADKGLKTSVQLWNVHGSGLLFGAYVLRLTGIVWSVVGILLRMIGETKIQGMTRDIFLGIVILAPIWVGAILAQRRKSKDL